MRSGERAEEPTSERCGVLGYALALALFAAPSAHAEPAGSEESSSSAQASATKRAASLVTPIIASGAQTPLPLERRRHLLAIDLLRLGFPSGIGVGFRYLPIPELAFEVGASSVVLATGFDASLAALPLPGGVGRRANLLLRAGYRTASLHGLADRMIVLVVPGLPSDAQLSISGAQLGFFFAQLGASYRFNGPLLFEMSLGYMLQLGRATSSVGGRAALSQAGARFPIGELRLTYLFDRIAAR